MRLFHGYHTRNKIVGRGFESARKWLSSISSFLWLLLSIGTLSLLAGCATYQPHPLQDDPDLALSLDSLTVEIMRQQGDSGRYEMNLADGIDLTEVAIIGVLNNPDLKAERARLKVAGAQLFAAGLLPDPQINATLDIPTGNTTGLFNAWGVGLGYDIIPLINRQARIDEKQYGKIQVKLELLWREWQVIQQARSLAVKYVLGQQRLALLYKVRKLYKKRYLQSTQALNKGDVTIDVNGTDLTALLEVFSQINQQDQIQNEIRHSLNLALGLAADVTLPLRLTSAPPLMGSEVLREEIAGLSDRRPDLMALRAGYHSQEARVRAAILSQFPSLSIGITRARDTSDVYTTGVGVSLNLPIFSGSRGAIAFERATREQLAIEYRARLSQTNLDIDKLIELQGILAGQQEKLTQYLPRLKNLVDRVRSAYQRGDMGALTFFNMEYTWVLKRLEQLDLKQSQWENSIALQTLLALPGPGAVRKMIPAGGTQLK